MTTQPTSQRLAEVCKERGITVESEFMWANREGEDACMETERVKAYADAGICSLDIFPALTFEEAWKLLPDEIYYEGEGCYYLWQGKVKRKLSVTKVGYYHEVDEHWVEVFYNESPAEAACLLLIWVIESGYWKEQS